MFHFLIELVIVLSPIIWLIGGILAWGYWFGYCLAFADKLTAFDYAVGFVCVIFGPLNLIVMAGFNMLDYGLYFPKYKSKKKKFLEMLES